MVKSRITIAYQKGKKIAKKVLKDPIVKEYIEGQKKLARKTVKKAIQKVSAKM